MYVDNITSKGVTLNSVGKSMQIEVYEKEIQRLNEELEEYKKDFKEANDLAFEYKNIIKKLEKNLEERKTYYCKGCSNIYEDSLGKTRLVNEDIFDEITLIQNRLKELKEGK